MNGLIICGVGRSGKTTLASMVAKRHDCTVIHTDCLITAFQETFPQLGIEHLNHTEKGKEDFLNFVRVFCQTHIRYGQTNIVIEGGSMPLDYALKLFDKILFKVVVLGMPNLTVDEWCAAIRKHDTEDENSYFQTDESLRARAEKNISKANEMFKSAKKLGIQIIETSGDRTGKFEDFVSKIKFSGKPKMTTQEIEQLKADTDKRRNNK